MSGDQVASRQAAAAAEMLHILTVLLAVGREASDETWSMIGPAVQKAIAAGINPATPTGGS